MLAAFFGKGIGFLAFIINIVTQTGEDTSSYLAAKNEYPGIRSMHIDWYAMFWMRPSQIASIYLADQRYAENVMPHVDLRLPRIRIRP